MCACGAALPSAEPRGASCPRCRVALAATSAGVAVAHQCPRCRGIFLSARAWCALLSIPDRAPLLAESVDRTPGPPGAALVETVTCPACVRPMERGRFAAGSDVVIDVCERQHGLWLDAGELVGLLGFVARRREVGAQGAEREVAASEPGRDLERLMVASQPPSRIVVVERRRGFGLPLAVIVVALLAASAGGAFFLKRTLPTKMVEEAPKKSAEQVQ